MQGDYTASGVFVNGSDPELSPTPPAGHQSPTAFTPPLTFDDSDLIQFYLNDGPYLDLHTDAVYRALIRCTDPQSGWSFPSIPDLVYLAKMKPTAVRKYIKVLCEEPENGGLGKFTKVARQNGSEANGYFLHAWANDLVPEPMNEPSDDPLEEAKRVAADKVWAAKDWEIETRDLHIEQLKAQLEALGVIPESLDEPLRHANPFAMRRGSPPPLPEEPPPPDYWDVDGWVLEHWERLHSGGVKDFIAYRNWVRKNPQKIEAQEADWRDKDRADERVSQSNVRQTLEERMPAVPTWDGPPPDPEAEQLWRQVLDNLQTKLPRPTFETWLKPTVGVVIETGDIDALVVVAQNLFAVEWLERRMFQALHRALESTSGRPMELRLQVIAPTPESESAAGG